MQLLGKQRIIEDINLFLLTLYVRMFKTENYTLLRWFVQMAAFHQHDPTTSCLLTNQQLNNSTIFAFPRSAVSRQHQQPFSAYWRVNNFQIKLNHPLPVHGYGIAPS